jgi:hypothetical protein
MEERDRIYFGAQYPPVINCRLRRYFEVSVQIINIHIDTMDIGDIIYQVLQGFDGRRYVNSENIFKSLSITDFLSISLA